MSHFLLYNGATAPTGPELARRVGISCGKEPPVSVDVLVRWGTSKEVECRAKSVLNDRWGILRAIDKRRSLAEFRGRGVLAPFLFPGRRPLWLPAVGRTKHHQEGCGFWLCLQEADVARALEEGVEYFVPYVPTKAEYRVHVVDGHVLFMQRKVLKRGKGDLWPWLRNVKSGWSLDRCEEVAEVAEVGVRAVRALGLDFGAADVLESDAGLVYVLEVNTAPRLRGEKLDMWAEALGRRLNV